MRLVHALVPALSASALVPSRAHADPPPKLVLDDVMGFGSSSSYGWLSYQRDSSPLGAAGTGKSTSSYLSLAPRFEALVGQYLTLGAQLEYSRYASDFEPSDGSTDVVLRQSFAIVPTVGVRVPLPRSLSLWAHAGFGGGAQVDRSTATGAGSALPGVAADTAVSQAALLTRFRADFRVAYEPVRGVMLTVGPQLQRTVVEGAGSTLSLGGFAGVSFVIH